MRVVLLGDTHVPTREPDVPGWVEAELERADHAVFTGDFDTLDAYEDVEAAAPDGFTAVAGNMDPPELDLPDVATADVGGVEFVVTHGTGPVASYESRVVEEVRTHGSEDAVGVAGHTHRPLDTTAGGTRILNPGSATGANPADDATLMVATAEDGELSVELVSADDRM